MVYIPGGSGGTPTRGVTGSEQYWPVASSIPSNALRCDGAAVSRATYAALFAIIGTTFGVGDGSTTFNLPSRAEKVIRCAKADDSDVGGSGGADTHSHGGATGAVVAAVPAGAVPPPAAIGAHSHSISSDSNVPAYTVAVPIIWT